MTIQSVSAFTNYIYQTTINAINQCSQLLSYVQNHFFSTCQAIQDNGTAAFLLFKDVNDENFDKSTALMGNISFFLQNKLSIHILNKINQPETGLKFIEVHAAGIKTLLPNFNNALLFTHNDGNPYQLSAKVFHKFILMHEDDAQKNNFLDLLKENSKHIQCDWSSLTYNELEDLISRIDADSYPALTTALEEIKDNTPPPLEAVVDSDTDEDTQDSSEIFPTNNHLTPASTVAKSREEIIHEEIQTFHDKGSYHLNLFLVNVPVDIIEDVIKGLSDASFASIAFSSEQLKTIPAKGLAAAFGRILKQDSTKWNVEKIHLALFMRFIERDDEGFHTIFKGLMISVTGDAAKLCNLYLMLTDIEKIFDEAKYKKTFEAESCDFEDKVEKLFIQFSRENTTRAYQLLSTFFAVSFLQNCERDRFKKAAKAFCKKLQILKTAATSVLLNELNNWDLLSCYIAFNDDKHKKAFEKHLQADKSELEIELHNKKEKKSADKIWQKSSLHESIETMTTFLSFDFLDNDTRTRVENYKQTAVAHYNTIAKSRRDLWEIRL